MKIIVVSKKPVFTAERGRLPKDVPVDVSSILAKFLIDRGEAVLLETKEALNRPTEAAGMGALSSASPVAQVLQPTMLSESAFGAKRRGRPRKEASLLQTPLTA